MPALALLRAGARVVESGPDGENLAAGVWQRLETLPDPRSPQGRDRIVELIRRIRGGRTILMVEHNLSVVEGLCDIITVLTRGRILAEGDYATVSANPDVIAAYLGTPHA